jgi:hypothetical protein
MHLSVGQAERPGKDALQREERAGAPLDVMSVPQARQRWRGHAEAVPTGISLTIVESANQVVRPAYTKLDEGCSE